MRKYHWYHRYSTCIALRKKWSFPLRISSVIMTKSAGNYGFDQTSKKSLIENFFFFFEQCRFISDFKHKAEIFNHFFSNQCSLLNNNRKLPANLNHITDRCISSVTFSAGDIGKVIKKRIGIPISVFGHWKFVMTPLINL